MDTIDVKEVHGGPAGTEFHVYAKGVLLGKTHGIAIGKREFWYAKKSLGSGKFKTIGKAERSKTLAIAKIAREA